jgi:alpha-tubulin suppressor-like RCC1 family protein
MLSLVLGRHGTVAHCTTVGPHRSASQVLHRAVPQLIVATCNPGVVLTFGQNDVGQLGLGESVLERTSPTLLSSVDHVIDLCAGGMHTVCLTEYGEVRVKLVT